MRQSLKAIATSQLSRPPTASQRQEILGIVDMIKSDANGAGLGDADVLNLLDWVLTYMGQGESRLGSFPGMGGREIDGTSEK